MDKIITVTVEGGVVQSVDGIPDGVTVRVLDFDTDGAEDDSLTALPEWREGIGQRVAGASGIPPPEDTT